jgi:hypothetical protein
MSVFLNIISAVLILPVVLLAAFFLFIDALTGQTLGSLFDAIMAPLQILPDPDSRASVAVAVLLAITVPAGVIYLTIRFAFLFPLFILVLGLGSLSCVLWDTGIRGAADNLLPWAAVVGVILSAAQLRRALVRRIRPA